jgi:hypothetical protein
MPRVMDFIWPGPFVVQSIHVVARSISLIFSGSNRARRMSSQRR